MTTPYRTATLTPPVDTSPPWWQRVWFRVDREDAAQRWRWARRAIGGRWTLAIGEDCRTTAWDRVSQCPARGLDGLGCDKHKCHCPHVLDGMCHVRKCYCEVWP